MKDNNSPKKENGKKTITLKKLLMRRIIFILIFILIAIGVTYCLVNNTTSNNDTTNNEAKNKETDEEKEVLEKTIDLNETYNKNALKIIEYTEIYQGVECKYYQIDGLKDEAIQIAINYNLKKDVESLIDEGLKLEKVDSDNLSVYSAKISNFANTISIYYSAYAQDSMENDYAYLYNKEIAENYDLTTGNRLKLNDIFKSNSGSIIASYVYNDVIASTSDITFNENLEGKITDYNDIEEEIFKLINDFKNERDILFYFDEQKVTLLDYYANIIYSDHLDSIIIYDKFKTEESIFDGRYKNLEDLPVLVRRYDADYTVLEQGENYYIDISIFNFIEESYKNDAVNNSVKKMVDDYVKEIKEEAENSDNFIIVNRAYSIYRDTYYNEITNYLDYSGNYNLDLQMYRFEITKSKFETEVFDNIIKIFRYCPKYETGEAWYYNNLFGLNLTYDYETGEKYLTNLETKHYEDILINPDGEIIDNVEENLYWDVND